MNAVTEMPSALVFTDSAAGKVKDLIAEEGNPELKLRVFVTGGGCSGFQYGFEFDEQRNEDDMAIVTDEVTFTITPDPRARNDGKNACASAKTKPRLRIFFRC